MMSRVDQVPGFVPALLRDPSVSLLRAEDAVFTAMVDGWRAQMLARGLTTQSIKSATSVVARFQEFTN